MCAEVSFGGNTENRTRYRMTVDPKILEMIFQDPMILNLKFLYPMILCPMILCLLSLNPQILKPMTPTILNFPRPWRLKLCR